MKKMRTISQKGIDIIDLFIKSLKDKDLNPRTIQEYASDLKHFIAWHEYKGLDTCKDITIFAFEQMSKDELQTYLDAMRSAKLKISTINRRLSSIKLLFDWAYNNNFLSENFSKRINLTQVEKSSPRMINKDEEKRLLDVVKAHGSLRDQCILKLMIHTGLRAGETCRLKLSDINLADKGGFIIVGSEAQVRSIPLNNVCKSILDRYMPTINKDTVYLFSSNKTGGLLTERALRHLIKKYIDLAELKGISAFSLRHYYGYKQAAKTPIHKLAQIMGHSSLNPTMNYIKPNGNDTNK